MSSQHASESTVGGIIKSMGLVFGDIGTSPIYTLSVIFALTAPTRENVFGILSLVVWTLILLVTVEYAWLAMALSYKGEGGTIVLKEILVRLIKPGRQLVFVTFLTFLGVSLLLGDGVITPAISILSAVEGLTLIPGFSGIHQTLLIGIAAVIAIGLFIFQFKGTDRVASAFGPIMVVWFIVLTLSGLTSIATTPEIVGAISPHHALNFFANNGFSAFFVLSEVILCATGGEALYADMGHLGREPILHAWSIVFFALVINYLGQGAYALQHGAETNILFSMVRSQAPLLYVPFLLLTICATIIASQALISGVFSVVYQGITTRIMPLMRVDYTSMRLKSQIYISAVNWSMMCAVIFIMFLFKKSENLAAAYGLAVTGTMAITGMMMIMIYYARGSFKLIPIAILVTIIDFVFLISNLNKLQHGGYWSLILASIPLSTILIWTYGQRCLYRALAPLDLETFLTSYQQIYAAGRIRGCALFFTKGLEVVPPYAVHTILKSNIVYERNVFISLMRTDEPFGQEVQLKEGIAPGLDFLDIQAGYMAVVDIEQILRENGIREKVIFYGIEEIHTKNPIWRVFSLIKKISPNFVQFNKLPAGRMHGVATRVEM
jgi:KUP system potassium uptake protein